MSRVAASLAAVAIALGLTACGGDGAEPGASREATLVLDFTPNAVHAGIYAALAEGYYSDEGIDLEVREPSASTDAPKLLEAGRADFAVMDIHDVGLAQERGLDIRLVGPIVQRPLASVIAGAAVDRPRDLAGGTVGVTGLPSDDAVLDAVLAADGIDPDSVERVTIGFDSVAALAAGRVDAVTAFWNAEGVALERLGVPTRVFRVDDYGAPRYPELVLVTAHGKSRSTFQSVAAATKDGYKLSIKEPNGALDALVEAHPELDRAEQDAQLRALLDADAFEPLKFHGDSELERWSRWALKHGVLSEPLAPEELFEPAGPGVA